MKEGFYWVRILGADPDEILVTGNPTIARFKGNAWWCMGSTAQTARKFIEVLGGPLLPPDGKFDGLYCYRCDGFGCVIYGLDGVKVGGDVMEGK